MAFSDRFQPLQNVWKFHDGAWDQPGDGGQVTPIFPATVSWKQEDTDSFWGPSVHWNTHLKTFVMLMNRSCCSPGWPQEGVYASYNPDLDNPAGWSPPEKILSDVFWYPQVLGLGVGETDSIAGERARLYVFGESRWELEFIRGPEPESEPPLDTPPATAP